MDLIHSVHLPPWPSFAEVVAAYIARKRAGLRGSHEVGIQRVWPGQQGPAGETKTFEINIGAAPWIPERDVIRRTAERVGIGNFPTDHELLWMIRDAEGVLNGDVEQRWEQREYNLFDVFEEAWYWWDIVETAAAEVGCELDEDEFLAKAILLIDAWCRSLGQPVVHEAGEEVSPVLTAFRRRLPIYQTPGNLHHFLTRMIAVGHRPQTVIQEIQFWTRVCEQVNARRGAHVRRIRDWFVARGNQRLLPRDRPNYRPMDTLGMRMFRVCLDAGEHHVHHLQGRADVAGAFSPCRMVMCAIVRTDIPAVAEFLSPRANWPAMIIDPGQTAGSAPVEWERFDLVVVEVEDGAIIAARPQASLALDAVAHELNWREPGQWMPQGPYQLRSYETRLDRSELMKILRTRLPRREIAVHRDRSAVAQPPHNLRIAQRVGA